LPTTLPEEDLTNIARHLMPEADKATLLRLVGFAQVSDDYVAGIERIVKRARYMVRQQHDKLSVRQAVKMAASETMPAQHSGASSTLSGETERNGGIDAKPTKPLKPSLTTQGEPD
jgi:hypothetical protein